MTRSPSSTSAPSRMSGGTGQGPRLSSPEPAISAPSDSITRKLFALIARAHQMLGDTGSALRVSRRGFRWNRTMPSSVQEGGGAQVARRICGRGGVLADDPGPVTARTVRQRGHGDLRTRDERSLAALAAGAVTEMKSCCSGAGAGSMPRRPRGTRQAGTSGSKRRGRPLLTHRVRVGLALRRTGCEHLSPLSLVPRVGFTRPLPSC